MFISRGRGCNLNSRISHLEECLGTLGVAQGPSQEKKQAKGPGLRLHFDPMFIVLLQHVILV